MKLGVRISAICVAVLLAVYYFYGFSTIIAFIASACVHEIGHIVGVVLFGGKIKSIHLEIGGFSMDGAGLASRMGEIVAILLGPMFGLGLAALCCNFSFGKYDYVFKLMGQISLWLSAYNLLPAMPLDGGRIAERLLSTRIRREKREKILEAFGVFSGVFAALSGIFSARYIFVGGGICLLIAQTGIVKRKRVL
ncbi:MAG: site-2 protease family protein [Bacillota bacterium]|nr:site-2 protease family protein [Bacillota bacterium]